MSVELTKIPGIGAATAAVLGGNGIKTVRAVAKMDVGVLAAVKGFGEAKAAAVIAAAQDLIDVGSSTASATAGGEAGASASGEKKDKGEKKKESKKKDKGKGKDKKKKTGKNKGKKKGKNK